jgi:hypothetical protein
LEWIFVDARWNIAAVQLGRAMMQKVNGQPVDAPSQTERRALPRYRPSSLTYVNVGPHNGGIVLDISESGLQLAAGENLGRDEVLPLSLQLLYRTHPIEVTGQLIWLSESRRTGGFQFVSLTEQVRNQIRDWMANEENATADLFRPLEVAETIALGSDRREPFEAAAVAEPLAGATAQEQAPPLVTSNRAELAEDRGATICEFEDWAPPGEEGPCDEPSSETPPGRFRTALVSGLMMICFAAGVMVGVTWGAKAFESRTVHTKSAKIVPESAGPDNAQSAPATSLMPPPAPAGDARPASPANFQPVDDSVLVTPPRKNAQPELVTLPQIGVSASESVAISVRQFVLVPASPGPASAHHPERLVGGRIAGPPLEPLPSGLAINPSGDVVRLRLAIDEDGEVSDLIKMEGRADLVSIAESVVGRWIQTPSRLGSKPIASIEDVIVTFRPAP